MKTTLLIIMMALAVGCASPRVLVKVPCDEAGPGLANCEKVKDL